MRTGSCTLFAFAAALAVVLIASSCSTGPTPPQPGTPAFYWAAAKEMYKQGDYLKTQENLAQITKSDNEFTARARPWDIVISAGIADGCMELADIYEDGARKNRANPLPFRREASTLRGMASASALELTEAMHVFAPANKDKTVPFDFDFPAGTSAQPPNGQKVSAGMMLPEAEAAGLRKAMIQRGVLLSVSRAAGAPDDTAKALEIFKKGNVQVPGNVFLMAGAGEIYDISQLYTSNKLDQPNRLQTLCNIAKETLGLLPQTKESKALSTKIDKALKKIKTS